VLDASELLLFQKLDEANKKQEFFFADRRLARAFDLTNIGSKSANNNV